jgi:quercetin dioxygenase-like cupin family protein
MADHVGTVAAIYEAFGRGDVPSILEQLSDDVAWEQGARDTGLPHLQPRRGKDEVVGFFQGLMETLELTEFVPGPICEGGDVVMVPVTHAGRIIGGGEIPRTVEAHLWEFGPDGKVVAFRHLFDYAVHERAAARRAAPLTGQTLDVLGDPLEVLLAGDAYEVFRTTARTESGPPPHAHPWTESYYVLDGEVDMTVGDGTSRLGPGGFAAVPAGTLHTYRVVSDSATFLMVTSGHRASGFFADVAAHAPGELTEEMLPVALDVARRHGLTSPLMAEA